MKRSPVVLTIVLALLCGVAVLAAAGSYPELAAFYRSLDEQAELVEVFAPGPGERGPVLKLYRLGAPRPPS